VTARLLAIGIIAATIVLVAIGTIWPVKSAQAMAAYSPRFLRPSSSPEAAVQNVVEQIGRHDLHGAYDSLANKNEFTEPEFVRDIRGTYFSLRSYPTLDSFDIRPLHASGDEAKIRAIMHWETVVGGFDDVRDLRVTKTGGKWQVVWPLVKEPRVPPQVIPVNYLRWDVIYRGPEDDWGTQDVESPHVRIVDMHPIDRGGGVVLLGELLNEDVVPAYVTVKASLLAANGSSLATEDAFDKISHILLPKQVTPFRIDFRNIRLSQVDSVRIQPASSLIAASADPVIEIQDQSLTPLPNPSLKGELVNQSGQVVNIAHVLGTLYDNKGQLVWVSDDYVNRAVLPETPVPFTIPIPADLSAKVSNFRVVTSTYSASRFQ
jgi:hypothetical protein